MSRIVLTGSASGIGAAMRARLEDSGHDVVGVDLDVSPGKADVGADLSTPAGRAHIIGAAQDRWAGKLDSLVLCAGVGPTVPDPSLIVSVNYFGSAVLLDELRPALAAGDAPAAVVTSSNSITAVPGIPQPLIDACLDGDEDRARSLATDPVMAYAGSKLALARKVRRDAPGAAWAGNGIRLNAVAPGATRTPLLQRGLDDPDQGRLIREFPVPLGDFGDPDQIASVLAFLVSEDAAFVCGSVWFVDGGSDALLRSDDWPAVWQMEGR
jgi:NAD(P)-dependent dehydrogenase (short-subunit alcohol dehydrogenase family)